MNFSNFKINYGNYLYLMVWFDYNVTAIIRYFDIYWVQFGWMCKHWIIHIMRINPMIWSKNQMSIKKKLILINVMVAIIPMIAFAVLLTDVYDDSVNKRTEKSVGGCEWNHCIAYHQGAEGCWKLFQLFNC